MQKAEEPIPFYDQCEKHFEVSVLSSLEKHLDLSDNAKSKLDLFFNEISKNPQKYVSSQRLRIAMTYSDALEREKFMNAVKAFVYYRLFYFLQNLVADDSEEETRIYVFTKFLKAIQKMEKNELFIPLVLHESRGLIDNGLAGENSAHYLKMSMNMEIVEQDPNDELQQDYREGVLFFKETLKSPLARKAIREFLTSVNFEEVKMEIIEKSSLILQNLEFILIKGVCFVAMNGVNNKIYFNIDMLQKKNRKFNKARTLANCYHEAAHYLIRTLKEDFGIITPRNNELTLEAGFRMEEILFGGYQKTYWSLVDEILNQKLWNDEEKPLPLLEKIKMENLANRSFSNPYRSGCEEFTFVGYE